MGSEDMAMSRDQLEDALTADTSRRGARIYMESIDALLADLEGRVAALTRERDALLAEEYARPWRIQLDTCRRLSPSGEDVALVTTAVAGGGFIWRAAGLGFAAPSGRCATMVEAREKCDAELTRAGWYLAPDDATP